MNTHTPKKLLLLASVLTLAFAFAVPAVRAEDGKEKKMTRKEKELEKYDLNKDGKLDDAEKAAMKADKEKAKAEKAEKKAAKEAKKAEKAGKAAGAEAQK